MLTTNNVPLATVDALWQSGVLLLAGLAVDDLRRAHAALGGSIVHRLDATLAEDACGAAEYVSCECTKDGDRWTTFRLAEDEAASRPPPQQIVVEALTLEEAVSMAS